MYVGRCLVDVWQKSEQWPNGGWFQELAALVSFWMAKLSQPSGTLPVPSLTLLGSGRRGPPSFVSISRLSLSQPAFHYSEQLLFTTRIIIYTVSQTVYHAELTLGFFKCAIKKKSGHLYLQEHNSWGHDVNERRYPKIISKGPENGIFLVYAL